MSFKRQYPDKVMLYRMGDFFETFGDDAKIAAKVLNITLTKRNKEQDALPLAGFPHHALEQYLPKLVEAGHCVVIVDQIEDPKLAKGIVKRAVTRIITPGTIDNTENSPKNLYIMAIYPKGKNTGVALCDLVNGKFKLTQIPQSQLQLIINAFEPVEALIIENTIIPKLGNIPIQPLPAELLDQNTAESRILKQFNARNIHALGLENIQEGVIAASMLLHYIEETQKINPQHIKKIELFKKDNTMILDSATIRNLELVQSSQSGTVPTSLFGVLDSCKTTMGRRLLYSWILNPLTQVKEINERLKEVDRYLKDFSTLTQTREYLSEINDLERIAGKIGLNRVNARDYIALKNSILTATQIDRAKDTADKLNELVMKIESTILENPPISITEGHIIKPGINKDVDELRSLSKDSKKWVNDFIQQERERTGIPSLKIGFTSVFGYYIEVTKAHQEKIPADYIRKQTLVNAERYITEELKNKEEIILTADEKLAKLEYDIFENFRESTIQYLPIIQKLAEQIAKIDVLTNYASISATNNYNKPTIFNNDEEYGILEIIDGRHPVIEKFIQEPFISNNTLLDKGSNKMAILTGPNMSGKSTYIRQVALIVLMAQIGCFVPAKSAKIAITDRIFTRVGAYDDLSRGRSTFMVEMDEAANIANNATENSLVILDEIGRGTSTYDGVSIAWAIAEYLIKEIGARTLFATHYHELLKLPERIGDGAKNFNVMVDEDDTKDEVVFLRKIVEGGTDRSYGIYVAKMAGLPEKIIKRAKEILSGFEQESMFSVKNTDFDDGSTSSNGNGNGCSKNGELISGKKTRAGLNNGTLMQSSSKKNYPNHNSSPDFDVYSTNLFGNVDSGILGDLKATDINKITPVDAFNKIVEWKKRIGI